MDAFRFTFSQLITFFLQGQKYASILLVREQVVRGEQYQTEWDTADVGK